jgi:hypothetical protein
MLARQAPSIRAFVWQFVDGTPGLHAGLAQYLWPITRLPAT